MGFRIGWFWKWLGITWGPRGGFRLYGMFGGRRGKSGCLIPFVVIVSSALVVLALVMHLFLG